jgi:Skp family chaperone for outer membrane proteins
MTKFVRPLLLAFALAWAALGGAAPALAQKLPPAVLGIIDNQRIFRDAASFKSLRQQLEQYRLQYQTELQKEEGRLRNEEQDLVRQRAVLAPEAFDQRRRDFERKASDAQRKVQERSRALETAFNSGRATIGKTVQQIINDIGTERGITVVMDKVQVQFASDQLDITTEVLKRLDQRMPNVRMPAPAVQ